MFEYIKSLRSILGLNMGETLRIVQIYLLCESVITWPHALGSQLGTSHNVLVPPQYLIGM